MFQEPLTTITRLRRGMSPENPREFRTQMRDQLNSLSEKAQGIGFTQEDSLSAGFAVVAFLDETILKIRPPSLVEWLREPLQDEMFGHFVAGNVFFERMEEILSRPESSESIDLLELYSLCILLGYQGRFANRPGELSSLAKAGLAKVWRFRGALKPLLVLEEPIVSAAPIAATAARSRKLVWLSAIMWIWALLLSLIYHIHLAAGLKNLRSLLTS
jgi:type VI secretion system protein ImpK